MCDFCNGGSSLASIMVSEKCGYSMRILNGKLVIQSGKIDTMDKLSIIYCPMCGERLSVDDWLIAELPSISIRTFNCLYRAGFKTLRQVSEKTEGEVFKIKGLGKKSFDEVKNLLEERGLAFKE